MSEFYYDWKGMKVSHVYRGALNERTPETPKADEQVNSPAHYNAGKVEIIDCIESVVASAKSPFDGYLAGNVVKYVARYAKKGGKTDLEKAAWYLSRLIERTSP